MDEGVKLDSLKSLDPRKWVEPAIHPRSTVNDQKVKIAGPHYIVGVVPPIPDFKSTVNQVLSYYKRCCADLPDPVPKMWRRLVRFNKSQIRSRVTPIPENVPLDYDEYTLLPTFETLEYWLRHANMRECDRVAYRKEWHRLMELSPSRKTPMARSTKFWRLKSFLKNEHYETYKYPRGIQPRDLGPNMIFGPIMHAIEMQLFHENADPDNEGYYRPSSRNPEFVKSLTMDQRAAYLLTKFDGQNNLFGTDASSFECLMRSHVQLDIELPMMKAHLANRPAAARVLDWVYHNITACTCEIAGQYGQSRGLRYPLLDMRCSGDMQTSLGNGWCNMIFLKFAFSRAAHCSPDQITVVCEGDDGLIAAPKCEGIERIFTELGLTYKFDRYHNVRLAKFCKIVIGEGGLLREAIGPMAKAGWIDLKYARSSPKVHAGLLRMKALSFIHSYPRCPILSAWCLRVLELTADAKTVCERLISRERNSYYREETARALKSKLPDEVGVVVDNDRRLYEEAFGTPPDVQIRIEQDLEVMTLKPLFSRLIIENSPPTWAHFYHRNVVESWHLNIPCAKVDQGKDYSSLIPGTTPDYWASMK